VTDNEYWTLVLVLGAVVILAVVALLSLLVYFVKLIDRRVAEVRYTLESVAENTAHAALIPQTAEKVDAVLAEGLQHHLFLGRVAGGNS
jgi:Na+-transporting methylmalonyl-CoA/oxaloacetate decarboxylase gamma subunit